MEDLVYNTFAYLIVAFAVFIVLKKAYAAIWKKSKTDSCDSGCSGCSTTCDLKQLVQK